MRWNVQVKDLRSVKVNGMKAKMWPIDDLQPLTFLNGKIYQYWFVHKLCEWLHTEKQSINQIFLIA